ncbi:BRCT domain-containing protein [Paraflavitalea sp. CAU 1676]|uniref:BRCT domain-containing protein n=1 Tax=Paraflavitalea sp. CAU 1676 TaxID=3032598 RepID=UPI0023DC039C|nr:BRCT domain-containing protein [Paraflavitalea sp. CAU 1676]MDF2192091.1 hypothetical protein [Paraflavitalea sp. CAU 1676]
MRTLLLQHTDGLPDDLLKGDDLVKLVVRNSTISLPANIGTQKQLKELHLIDCKVDALPAGLLQLHETFFFFERNEPANVQVAALVLYDHQRKKISREHAELYLDLLKSDSTADCTDPLLYDALDYRLPAVRSAALARLHNMPVPDSIAAGSVICIQGKPSAFNISDIKERLNNLQLKLTDKPNASVTHVIVAEEPGWNGKAPAGKSILTDQQFYQWLNKADQLFLSNDTEENKDARQNIADMLHSGDASNAELALQMLKTNGVSKALLTDLFLFYHKTQDKGLKRKAKQIFKQHAPEPVVTYLEANAHKHLGTLEVYTHFQSFIEWAESGGYLDVVKIALHNRDYSSLIAYGSLENSRKMMLQLIEDETLDLSEIRIDQFTPGLLATLPIRILISRGTMGCMIPGEVLTSLHQVEVLILSNRHYVHTGLPDNMESLTSLRQLQLGVLDKFPKGILTIPQLEHLKIQQLQYTQFPAGAQWPASLRSMIIQSQYWEKIDDADKQRLEATLPAGCEIIYEVIPKQ